MSQVFLFLLFYSSKQEKSILKIYQLLTYPSVNNTVILFDKDAKYKLIQ